MIAIVLLVLIGLLWLSYRAARGMSMPPTANIYKLLWLLTLGPLPATILLMQIVFHDYNNVVALTVVCLLAMVAYAFATIIALRIARQRRLYVILVFVNFLFYCCTAYWLFFALVMLWQK